MKNGLVIIWMCIGAMNGWAQYTYYNQLGGTLSDSVSDVITDIELINDTIYAYGGYGDFEIDGTAIQLQKYNLQGELLNTIIYPDPVNTTVFTEFTFAFKKTLNEDFFYYSNSFHDSTGQHGVVAKVNKNLDTLWTKQYDNFAPYTSYMKNMDVGDGLIIVGEMEGTANQVGTMLTKIDYDGNIIWDQVLRHANGDINRNSTIVEKDSFFIIGGGVLADDFIYGLITKTNQQGDILWEHFYDYSDPNIGQYSGSFKTGLLNNGDVVSAISIDYESAGPSPLDWYSKVVVNKVDVENDSLYWEHEYLANHESENSGILKILPTMDGGMAILGGDYNGNQIAWMLKIDTEGNLEWHKYYFFDDQYQQFNQGFDVEQCSDGSYLIVGKYSDWNLPGTLPRSWMIKVDACGDVEWNGCLPVGIADIEMKPKVVFVLYPNPAQDYVTLEMNDYRSSAEEVLVWNRMGQLVHRFYIDTNGSITIDTRNLANGLYQVVVKDKDGVVGSQKLEISR